jgi:hypothetical protein
MVLWKKWKGVEKACGEDDGIDAGNDLDRKMRRFMIKRESLTVPFINSISLVWISRDGGRKHLISGMIETAGGNLLSDDSWLKWDTVALPCYMTQRIDHWFKKRIGYL